MQKVPIRCALTGTHRTDQAHGPGGASWGAWTRLVSKTRLKSAQGVILKKKFEMGIWEVAKRCA